MMVKGKINEINEGSSRYEKLKLAYEESKKTE